MDRSIVCVSEFISKYKISEEVCLRFLPCENDVCVVSQEEFERFRNSRKRRAIDILERQPVSKKQVTEYGDLHPHMGSLSATLGSLGSSLSCSEFTDKSVADTSFELLESSFLLCSDGTATGGHSDVHIIESSEFQPLDSQRSSPPPISG
ncbi:uncharacterized protein LALA0_S04e09230g [Lachancea lanzarotensis]|uniref:LALA0S04e09230g1_1 n=1 Tax=Lachancea lanzarotensis TaxID=1245769 RepID=A0A0C7MWW8_9SACH|nr:uncharacterized protein LALA0_S04e09230g [Lachancea lanzarotensis]CEP62161.1 LALA0S04e09230g1_1 [Lachancea lanzarotensis]